MDRAHRNKIGNGVRTLGPGYRVVLSKGEKSVDTLQAAKPPCSVINGP